MKVRHIKKERRRLSKAGKRAHTIIYPSVASYIVEGAIDGWTSTSSFVADALLSPTSGRFLDLRDLNRTATDLNHVGQDMYGVFHRVSESEKASQ